MQGHGERGGERMGREDAENEYQDPENEEQDPKIASKIPTLEEPSTTNNPRNKDI